jgi:putative tryptophan/tyrosine transport system substrate-binding protein
MNRRAFVWGALLLLILPLPGEAQQAKLWRIGWLCGTSRDAATIVFEAFQDELRGLGYIEGRHYAIEPRYASGRTERLPSLATELAALPVDVIVAPGTPTALAAMQATRNIPVVMVTVADPVGAGLVRSFARPDGNVTGTALALDELSHKWLEFLRTMRPRLSRVAVIQNSTNRSMSAMLEPLQASARGLGIILTVHDVTRRDALTEAFKAIATERAEAVVVLPDAYLQDERGRIMERLARVSLPSLFATRGDVVTGGLISYGPNFVESHRRAANYVDKILKGVKLADLPVERSTKFELVINLKTAKALGLTIPPSLLLRADQVID